MVSGSEYSYVSLVFNLHTNAFSLKNHGTENEVDGMFDLGAEMMDLPLEEKMKWVRHDDSVKSQG